MKMLPLLLSACFTFIPIAARAEVSAPPPKALSASDVHALQEGRGMGTAKPAELNGYPGPMHVLELAAKLGLSPEQRQRTQAIYDQMHAEAVHVGGLVVEAEHRLDALFADGAASAESLERATLDVAELHGRYRAVHLRAHLELRPVLSAAQVARYNELRGYNPTSK